MSAHELTGQRFNRLTVLRKAESRGRDARWVCLCDCGEETIGTAASITSGKKKSCGCLLREMNAARSGMARRKVREAKPVSHGFLLQKEWTKPTRKVISHAYQFA